MSTPAALQNHANVSVAAGATSVAAPQGPTNFLVSASRESVQNYAREGNDLLVSFKDGHTLRIEGFFANGTQTHNLVFVQDDGSWLASFDQAMVPGGDQIADAAVAYTPISQSTSTTALLALLGVAAGAGIIAAVAGGGGGDSDSGGNVGGGGSGGGTGTTPAAPSVAPIGNVIGSNGSQATDNAAPTLQGSGAPANSTISILLDGRPLATVRADANGNWSYTLPQQLPDGAHQIVITQTAPDGTTSAPTVIDFTVDTQAPAAPVVTDVSDDATPGTGPVTSGASANDSTPTLTGTAEAGSTVQIFNGATLIGSVMADANGNWSFTPGTALPDGSYTFTATATDAAGNTGVASSPFTLVIDTAPPAAPTVTQSNAQGLAGTAEAGSLISIDLDGDGTADATVTADGAGNWRYVPSPALPDGTTITVIATDVAGNASAPVAATVDSTVPDAPDLDSVTDDRAPVTGTLASGDTTNDATPTLSGRAEANSLVTIYDGTAVLGTVVADGDGNWQFTPTASLSEGSHVLTVTVTDAAGNTSAATAPFSLTVDTLPPGTPTVSPSNGAVLSGTADAGSTVLIDLDGDGTADASVEADTSGHWSYAPDTPPGNGAVVTVTATDAAGNASPSASTTIDTSIVDTTPPTTPTIAPTAGTTLSGTAEAGSTVNLDLNNDGTVDTTVEADDEGNWTYTPVPPIDDGVTVSVTATDSAGNTSQPATAIVDASAPPTPAIGTVTDNASPITGPLTTGGSTNDTTPTFAGTAEPGSTITLTDTVSGNVLGATTVDGDGNWTFTPPSALPPGAYAIEAIATDAVGNASGPSTAFELVIDTSPPAGPAIGTVTDNADPGTGPLLNGGITNDTTPAFSGNTQPGSTVNLYSGTTLLGTGVADENGNWTISPSPALVDGSYTVTAVATDPAGNTSIPGAAFTLTVDATPPAAPTIVTSNGTTLSGTAEANSTIDIDLDGDGTADATVTANDDGEWTYTPLPTLGDGAVVSVTATDAAGNASEPATITIDGAAPDAPSIDAATDDTTPATGALASGDSTNDTTPLLSGTAEPGSIVEISNGSAVLGTATADEDGNWTFTPTVPLTDGVYTLTATATDAAGNTGAASPAFTLTVDTAPPDAPNVTGSNGTTLTGTAEANSVIGIDLDGDGAADATVTADNNGTWTYTPLPVLPDGAVLGVTATDAAGNTSAVAAVTIDAAAPAAPVIVSATDNATPLTTPVLDGGSTNDTTPTLTGTAEPNSTINLYSGGALLGTVDADADGNWSFTPDPALVDDTYVVTATATDAVGNTSPDSAPFTLTVDTAPPATPIIDIRSGTALGGTAEAGSTLNIDLDGDSEADATVTADADGNWTYAPAGGLANGLAVSVTASDAAGNTSGPATATIDAAAPLPPVIVTVTDDNPPATSTLSSGASTNDDTPTLAGTAEPNSVINVYDGTTLLGTVTAASGTGAWTFTPDGLDDGSYTFTVTATDAAGNTSTASAPFTLTVDTVVPDAPSILSVTKDSAGPGVPVVPGGETNDATPLIAGVAEPFSNIALYNDGTLIGSTVADENGNWQISPATLPDDTYTLTAIATDAAGNSSDASASFTFTIDTAPPAAPDILPSDGTSLTGTAEPGSLVNIDIGNNGSIDATVGTDASGNWSYMPASPLGDGVVVSVTATDSAGNTGAADSTTVDIDLNDVTPPAVPTVNASNGTVLTGTAEAGSTVNLDLDGNGTPDTAVTATAGGVWTYTPPTRLPDGTTVNVSATDSAGNTSGNATVTIDGVAPIAPVIATLTDNTLPLAGTVLSGGSTNDTTPTLSGTAEPGSTVSLFSGTTLLGTVAADGLGNWSFTAATLIDGGYTVTATATDALGNTSAPSTAFSFTVDTVAPVLPTIAATNGTTLTGSAEANSTVGIDYTGDGVIDVTVNANGAGVWTYTPATPLANGIVVSATATDAAGNTSAAANVTVDAAAPATPVLLSVTDDVAPVAGTLISGAATNDTTPTLAGTAEAGATITVFDGLTLLGTATADINGNWQFTSPALTNGPHALTLTATDAVGNTSTATTAFNLTVDTNAPLMPVITRSSGVALSGTAEAGSTVNLDLNGDGTADARVTADTGGNWTFAPSPALTNGITISVTSTDAAGNTSLAATATVDALAPAAPVITTVTDNVSPVTGTLVNGGNTNDTTPTLAGTAEANSLVSVYNGSALLGTVRADGSGNWSFTTAILADATYALAVTATDAAGNVSAPSPTFTVTVDTIAPTVTATISTLTDDTGTVGDWVTGDHSPIVGGTLSGALGAGETLQVSLDGGTTWTNAVVSGTSWQWYAPGQLTDGAHSVSTRVVDAAGNLGTASTQAFSIVTNVAPQVTVRDAGGLLGIADANLLGLIELGQQQFFAASDYNNNIQQVRISFGGVLDLLALQQLNANAALAAELGLRFQVVNDPGLLGIGASSVMTITSLNGGTIDNLHLNEFLGSVTLSNGLLGINVGLLNSLQITATDSTGLSATSSAAQLLSAGVLTNLLGGTQPSAIVEGTATGNTLNGSAGDDRLYGYGGDDTLNGLGGNDLLRGGTGNDALNGGAGNDLLIGGAGNDTLTGGTGGDVFLWEVFDNTNGTGGNGTDTITDFNVGTSPNQTGLDRLDVSALLIGYQSDADGPAHYVNGVATIDQGDLIRNYLSVTNVNGNTVVSIDRDGAGGAFGSQTLVTLNNVTTNLETLLANHQILV
ncbi:Ig-like domain-containing protein [Cupriavidus sp. DL-D2]|uniref:Ig-like domain-containing protein n=1 Tax=Cupriavidus sp. DL-D2 TaxID=3144974 RepID=UPI003213FD38